jgi:hypothetical protein
MQGWQTRTFLDKTCFHHRKMGTGSRGILSAKFRIGCEDCYEGGHPLWELFRAIYQMKARPYIIGGIWLLAGYVWSSLRKNDRPISKELVEFHRHEQLDRLKKICSNALYLKEKNKTTSSYASGRQ